MATQTSINLTGNVDGSVVVGDNNFVVNNKYGTIFYQQIASQVRPRTMKPQPPRPPRGFVDRHQELAQLETLIANNEIVLLHAADGLGKSSLLHQVANIAAVRALPDGVILLEGDDVSGQLLGPNDILQRIFDALFESTPTLKVDETSARTYLSNTRPLVLLDEITLTTKFGALLQDTFPQASILIATDTPCGGEFLRLPLHPLPRPDSLNLLAERAGLSMQESDRPTFEALCILLEDLPLALTLVGNILRETATPPAEALRSLQSISPVSADLQKAAIDRAFALAFSKLTPSEQKTLSVAALTPGVSMAPEWLSAALGNVEVSHCIERLKALGLLYANSPRLRLPAGLRRPARQRAKELFNETALLQRLVNFLLDHLSAQPFHWNLLTEELGNLFGALRGATAAGDWRTVLRLSWLLDPYLTLHGLWDAWGNVLQSALQAARSLGNSAAEAWVLHQTGTRFIGLGDRTAAEQALRQALSLRKQIGDKIGMAYTQHNLSMLLGVPLPVRAVRSAAFSPKLLFGLTGIGLLIELGLAIFIGWSMYKLSNPLTLHPTNTNSTASVTVATYTPTPTFTATFTPTKTNTATSTPTRTNTATFTPSKTITATSTPTKTYTATSTPSKTNTATSTPTRTKTATFTPSKTHTPTFTLTNTPIPCNLGSFVADVTYPDNTIVAPNQTFAKTWRIKNIGSCSWNSSYSLIFDHQDGMGVKPGYSQPITSRSVNPGQTVDLTVNLTAPSTPGTYTGYWRLRDPGGVLFGITPAGGTFLVRIIVGASNSITIVPVFK